MRNNGQTFDQIWAFRKSVWHTSYVVRIVEPVPNESTFLKQNVLCRVIQADMKTITAEAGMRFGFDDSAEVLRSTRSHAGQAGTEPRAWLPAPPLPRVHVLPKPAKTGAARGMAGIWLPPERETLGERFMMIALTTGAVVGIGYGFSLLLDLVEGWASFHAGISGLLQ